MQANPMFLAGLDFYRGTDRTKFLKIGRSSAFFFFFELCYCYGVLRVRKKEVMAGQIQRQENDKNSF